MPNSVKILGFQEYLNIRGATPRLVEDGIPGKRTRAAAFQVFRNTAAPSVTSDDIAKFANRIGCTMKQMSAVSRVESSGKGYDHTGLLAALYERHYGWRRFKILNPLLSNPAPGGYTIDIDDDGINDSWEKIVDAALFFQEPSKAFECASYGSFQIMGAWWEKLQYRSVFDFVWKLSRAEAEHYEAFVRYIEEFNLIRAVRKISGNPIDCLEFAQGYNGKAQKGYDIKIAAEMRKLGG